MSWLERLARQISAAKGTSLTADQLYEEFESFRDNCRDPLLRRSYPSDMRHFRKAARPQSATVDIILSFMDRRYRGLSLPFTDQLAVTLERTAASKEAGELDRILRKEHRRRGQSYWPLAGERLGVKYNGHYVLFRIDSKHTLRAEPLSLTFRVTKPIMASMYWLCRGQLRVADLMANSYRFTGTTVCQSTDAVIEPGPISFMRAARGAEDADGIKPPLVMGGMIMGEKDDDPTTLFHSRVALVKLDDGQASCMDHLQFREHAARRDLRSCMDRLLEQPAVNTSLYSHFLSKKDFVVGPLDARNTLSTLSVRHLSPSNFRVE